MSVLRKIELTGGVLTAGLSLIVLLLLLREDQEAAARLARNFPFYRSLLIGSLIFVFPGLLVFIGSYLHSIKKSLLGQFCVVGGALVAVGIFSLLFIQVGAFYSLHFAFWIHFWSVMSAIMTSIMSFLVRR